MRHRPGFNGAAPARARNVKRIVQVDSDLRWQLQRGRARAGAECGISVSMVRDHPRRFNGAAPARARNVDRSVCESDATIIGFNGAAPARARNVCDAKLSSQSRP